MKFDFLSSEEFVVFTTREFALRSGTSLSAASHRLGRLERSGPLQRVTRGLWANPKHPYFTPLAVVPRLLGSEQGYVSFLSALHRHGILSQIPAAIQIATTGHPRALETPIGRFEFMRLSPGLMREGIVWSEVRCAYRIATAEKALLDTLYLSTRRGRRFASLPELDRELLNAKRFRVLLRRLVKDKRIRSAIEKRAPFSMGAGVRL